MIKISYLLLDAARIGNEMENALAFPGENSCLYEGRNKIELSGVGPFLFKTDNNSELNNWVIENGWGNSWGVALFSFILNIFASCKQSQFEHLKPIYFLFSSTLFLK